VALISCPECHMQISERAEACPHCGLPAKYFITDGAETGFEKGTGDAAPPDLASLRNVLIAFDHSYQSMFGANHYITARELAGLRSSFGAWAEQLKDKTAYVYCMENAPRFAVDFDMVNLCLRRYENLTTDAESHNAQYVDRVVEEEKSYFDNLLRDIDPNIKLDIEQRRAVVTDDDYCLLVAGAGAGKTTTMAAKVKYLVEKKHIPPEDIIVISYTRKTIDELKERINKNLRIPARICTFHSFAYDIVRKFIDTPPEVNYSSFNIIFEMLEKELFHDKALLRKVLLFLGFYFDMPADAMRYDNLNQYHLAKAAQDYETLKSGAGEHVKKVAAQRGRSARTITGEFLRSAQEAQIANFLYLNGLDYEYEPIYPFAIRGARKKYTPDFIIRQGEHTAYLEHYAVSESGFSYVLTPQEISKYSSAIKDKRKLHRQMGTRLLETWAWYKDRRPLTDHLREILVNEGFVLKERDFAEVYKKITDTSKDKYAYRMVQFLMTFIGQYKTCGYDAGGFEALRAKTDNPRTLLFLDIAEPIYRYYQEQQKRLRFYFY